MRIAIREQLTILIIVAVLVGLCVVSVPTWIYVNRFVIGIKSDGLALSASLKASRITAELELLQQTCMTIATRILVQKALTRFYDGVDGSNDWQTAAADIQSALSAGSLTGLLQARLYSRNITGGQYPLLNVTSSTPIPVLLPYSGPDGNPAVLSDTPEGYPPDLYPNITYVDLGRPSISRPNTRAYAAEPFPGIRITAGQGLLLGPLIVNSTYALVSISVPIPSNEDGRFVLGYMTVVGSASNLLQIRDSREGLGTTGMTLVVGPKTGWNRFSAALGPSNDTYTPDQALFAKLPVHFVIPVNPPPGQAYRHLDETRPGDDSSANNGYSFKVGDYPAVLDELTTRISSVNNQSCLISTTNERAVPVAVGFARTSTPLVNWTVMVEQAREEAFEPIVTLRNILLGTVLGTAGFVLILVFPCAHLSVLPIRRLKFATEKTIQPPGYEDGYDGSSTDEGPEGGQAGGADAAAAADSNSEKHRGLMGGTILASVAAFATAARRILWFNRDGPPRGSDSGRETTRRIFKIPGKVEDKEHLITDELTELTKTFNNMSDELVRQYSSLDEKVAQRTRELEISKKAAEAANESKTLFIANISHELKTPLNGILGMCAVCMEEDDVVRIKQSLKTLYKSGDLLLHLLEDLLSFSKNQIGQQLNLEEKEFRLADVRSQILTIFDKQSREGQIRLSVNFVGSPTPAGGAAGVAWETTEEKSNSAAALTVNNSAGASAAAGLERLPALGPTGMGRLRDMCLWGDQHRILQVIINLVSNSLKFTPAGGSVSLRIRCLGEIESSDDTARTSSSMRSSVRVGRSRNRVGSATSTHSKTSSNPAAAGTSATALSKTGASGTGSGHVAGTALSINPLDPKATPHIYVRERSPTPPPPGARPFMFEFEVEDTGPGIPEQMQQRVFEPFVQGDLGLSRKFGGTGLGLSICHQLATLMGGTITLRSAVGVGSTFSMRIPIKYIKNRPASTASSSIRSRAQSVDANEPDPAGSEPALAGAAGAAGTAPVSPMSPEPSASSNPPTTPAPTGSAKPSSETRLVGLSLPFFAKDLVPKPADPKRAELQMARIEDAMARKGDDGPLRVLVADDNSTNVEVVSRMLKLEHIVDVTIAKDGQEAYDLVKATMENDQRFDLIFMDIQMPNLDGLQSTRLIRKMGYKSPIVALTAFSEESNVRECMESGMDEFLSKPIRRPALKLVLRKFATIPEEEEEAIAAADSRRRNGIAAAAAASAPDLTRRGCGRAEGTKRNGAPAEAG